MDIPLKVVITFFVTLVVGITLIFISKDLLTDSSDKVKDIGETLSQDKILEKNSISNTEIQFLADECYNKYNTLKNEELCYILKLQTGINYTSSSTGKYQSNGFNTSKTIYIIFKQTLNSNQGGVFISD